MRLFSMCVVAAALGVAIPVCVHRPCPRPERRAKPAEKPAQPPVEAKEKKVDEFAEAESVLGGPAANPECVWLGRGW